MSQQRDLGGLKALSPHRACGGQRSTSGHRGPDTPPGEALQLLPLRAEGCSFLPSPHWPPLYTLQPGLKGQASRCPQGTPATSKHAPEPQPASAMAGAPVTGRGPSSQDPSAPLSDLPCSPETMLGPTPAQCPLSPGFLPLKKS